MQDLIENYKSCRIQLQKRLYEINHQLKNKALSSKERELLTARRDMLTVERTELLCIIIEMQKHLKGGLAHETNSGKYQRLQLFSAERTDKSAAYEPETA